jgi:hypothetical protein
MDRLVQQRSRNAPYHLTNYYLFERSVRFADIMAERNGAPVDADQVMAMQLEHRLGGGEAMDADRTRGLPGARV